MGNLTQEEKRNLENMREKLKDIYDKWSGFAVKAGVWEGYVAVNTAAQGYAVITDILSRNRKPPNP